VLLRYGITRERFDQARRALAAQTPDVES